MVLVLPDGPPHADALNDARSACVWLKVRCLATHRNRQKNILDRKPKLVPTKPICCPPKSADQTNLFVGLPVLAGRYLVTE